MNSCEQLTVPILFLIFNRPQETACVFAAIRSVRPQQLFIAADGPRISKIGEAELCEQTRSIAAKIDWPCEVKTLFRTENLGCGHGVSSAISWFFEQVEEGIILEDDCLPHESFFEYCANNLETYRNDTRVMMISGMSYLLNEKKVKDGCFLSRYYPIWGWATWRRAWQQYDFSISEWGTTFGYQDLVAIFAREDIAKFWKSYFDRIIAKEIDTWDVQWCFACIKNKGYALVPFNNLISNIGFNGTHANGQPSRFQGLPVSQFIAGVNEYLPSQLFDNDIYRIIGVIEQKTVCGIVKQCIKKVLRW